MQFARGLEGRAAPAAPFSSSNWRSRDFTSLAGSWRQNGLCEWCCFQVPSPCSEIHSREKINGKLGGKGGIVFASPVHPALQIRLAWSGVQPGCVNSPIRGVHSARQSITSVLGSLNSAPRAQCQAEIPGPEMLLKPQGVTCFESESSLSLTLSWDSTVPAQAASPKPQLPRSGAHGSREKMGK